MKITQSQRGFVVAMAIGMLLLPALAIALTPANPLEDEATVAALEFDEMVMAGESLPEGEILTLALGDSAQDGAEDDVVFSCRYAAEVLVAGSEAGSLSVIEVAALQALRPICEQANLAVPLAGPTAGASAPPVRAAQAPATTQPPSTSPPTTQAPTTAAAAGPGPSIGEYVVAGGSATLAFYSDSVEILDISTNAGFKVETEREGPAEIDIKFESDGIDSFIFVTRENGEWRVIAVDSGDEEDEEDEEDDD